MRLVTRTSNKTNKDYQCVEVNFPTGDSIYCFDDKIRMRVLETLVQEGVE